MIRKLSPLSSKMRGIEVKKFGGIKEMEVKENLSVPEISSDQVLVNVKSSGINPVDTYVREGTYSSLPPLPYTPGKDGAGIVEKVGVNVSHFKPGDRVFCSHTSPRGTLAEYTAVNQTHVFTLAQKLSFDEGASLGIPYLTAHRALFFKGKAQSGDKVLIHGASGAVGIASVQIAKAFGMTVVGTAGTQEGMNLVRSAGANAVYNHRDKNYVKEIENEHQDKFDVIIEMLANVNLQTDVSLMRKRGVTVIVGCRGDIKLSPRLLMGPESSIIGCALLTSTPEEWKASGDAIIKGIEDGWVKPVIAKTYKLSEAGQGHHDIIHSKGATGNLVVNIGV